MADKDKLIDDSLNLIKEGKFAEAKEILVSLYQDYPDEIEILKNLALCELNLKNPQKALEVFQKVLEKDENDATAWFYIGTLYALINRDENAEKAFLKVIELRPDYEDAYKNLILIYLKNGQLDKIQPFEEKLKEFDTQDYQTFYMLGTTYVALHQYEKAISYLLKAIEINPDNALLLNNAGSTYLALHKQDEALDFFKKSLEIDSENPVTYYNIAITLRLLDRHVEAYDYFLNAYKHEPSPFYLTSLAASALKSEHYNEAIKYYELIAASSDDKSSYNFPLACAYFGIKDYEKALELIEPSSEEEKKELPVSYKLKLIDIYTALQKYEEAKELYAEIVKKGGVDPDIYYDYAVVCGQSGEKDKAELILKKVLQLKPEFAAAHKDLGVLYLDSRLFDYAQEEFQKAYDLEPENPFIVYEYGNFFQITGEYKKAEEFYDKVLEMDFLTPDILLNIALNNLSKNNVDKAQEILERAVKLDTQNIRILYNLGKIYFIKNNKESAKQLLEDAYFLEKNPEIENMLGQIYLDEEDYDCAYSMFKSIDKKYPQNTANLMNLAKCSLKLGNKDEAVSYLHRYTEIFPEDSEAIAMLADLI